MPIACALLSRDAADAVRSALPEVPFIALTDGSMVIELNIEFTRRAAQLYRGVAEQIGSVVTVHEDERGILAFEKTPLEVTDYEGVVARMGQGGTWVPVPRRRTGNTMLAHAAGDLAAMSQLGGSAGILANALTNLVQQNLLELPSPEPDDLVVVVRGFVPGAVPVGHPDSGTHEVTMLSDGSAVLRTMWHVAARDDVEFVLAEWHTDWVTHHDDERGVPSFSARLLDVVREARDYQDALSRVGDAVEFLRPRNLSEVQRAPHPLLAQFLSSL